MPGLVILTVLLLIAAACTSGDDAGDSGDASTDPDTPTTAGTDAQDQATSEDTTGSRSTGDSDLVEIVDVTGTLRAEVPADWTVEGDLFSVPGVRILLAAPDLDTFRREAEPGLEIVAGRIETEVDRQLAVFRSSGPVRWCDPTTEVVSQTEFNGRPATRLEYGGCGSGAAATALLIGDEPTTFTDSITVIVGPGQPDADTILQSIGIDDLDPAPDDEPPVDLAGGERRIVSDASGRLSFAIPLDWTFDPKPDADLPGLGASPPDATEATRNMAVTAQLDPWTPGDDTERQLRAIIDQLRLEDQCEEPHDVVPHSTPVLTGHVIEWVPCGSNQFLTVAFAGIDLDRPDELISMVAITEALVPYNAVDALESLRVAPRS